MAHNTVSPPYFVLSVACEAVPGKPFVLDHDAKGRLKQVPPALTAFAKYYKAKLAQPLMYAGDIYLCISAEEDLFQLARQMVRDLAAATTKIKANAQRQPPLPLKEVVPQKELVALLHWMAVASEKGNLIPMVHTGREQVEIGCPQVAEFVEPAKPKPPKTLRARVHGVCRSANGTSICVLSNRTWLELPTDIFRFEARELFSRVMQSTVLYVGPAAFVAKGILRALPGGQLEDADESSDAGHQFSMYPKNGK